MAEEHTTARMWKKTHKLLRQLYAETGEGMIAILHRLVEAEWNRVFSEKVKP